MPQPELTSPDLSESGHIIEAIDRALRVLCDKDHLLLELDLHEVTICAKLACYLTEQEVFDGWDIDIEYNKDGPNPKKILDKHRRPDIIIHHRGKKENYVGIEVKKQSHSKGAKSRAKTKLRLLQREMNYGYVFLVIIHSRSNEAEPYEIIPVS